VSKPGEQVMNQIGIPMNQIEAGAFSLDTGAHGLPGNVGEEFRLARA
jgi:hypothetical protein